MSKAAQIVKVRTSDGIDFDVSLQVAEQIGLIQSWLQQERNENNLPSCDDTDDGNIIFLDRVTSGIFELVLKWCRQLIEVPMPMLGWKHNDDKNNLFQTILNQENADDSTMFELIIAADFLNIESLLHAGTNYVAGLIATCNSVEAIRKRFHVVVHGDFEEE
ncbi:SKP1-like protein 10 [Drosophila innubila]|uniref:SKP1-like protein 10 n=1 Tax=Drosophila innubila TaxID=198719 RepID=UPI00148B922A|nr:SKP1-like protein 10 [Drosophila innubila]